MKDHKRQLIFFVIYFVVIVFLSFGYWPVQQDDSYIFYSYAKNIVDGKGYVFNPGERINATTSPLYTLLLAAIYRIFQHVSSVSLPLIGHLIGTVSLFFICCISAGILKDKNTKILPLIFPLCFLAQPLLRNAVGMETFLALALALGTIYVYLKDKWTLVSVMGALAVLARPDSLLLILVLLVDYRWQKRSWPDVKRVFLFAAILLPWVLFSHFYFGDILPSSLWVKLGQTESGRWGTGWIFVQELFSQKTYGHERISRIVLFVLCLSLAGILKCRRWLTPIKKRGAMIILLWNLLYFIVYASCKSKLRFKKA